MSAGEDTASRILQVLDQIEVADGDDTPVLKKVRDIGKATAAELKASQDREAAALKELQELRTGAVKGIVDGLGLGSLDTSILDGRISGVPTEASVREALQKLGIPLDGAAQGTASDDGGSDDGAAGAADDSAASDLEGIANLGQRVDDAAGGSGERDLQQQILEAQSSEDVDRLMIEAGLAL